MKYFFLANSDFTKPYVVLNLLNNENWFIGKEIIIGIDKTSGDVFNLVNEIGLPYYWINSNKKFYEIISSIKPEYLICCGWNKLIPKDILSITKKANLNCHSSYLPDYKGASVFKHYWSNWENHAGATVHMMDEKFDSGNIICSQKIKIFWNDTPYQILYRTAEVTSVLIREAVLLIENGYEGIPQENGRYFYNLSNFKHVLYWGYNGIATILGLPKKITPHKVIRNKK